MGTRTDTSFIICLTGTESTGKTTLATQLAHHLDVPLVPEIARTWLASRTTRTEGGSANDAYGPEDVLAIARAQEEAETALLATGAPLIIADTDQTVISVWWNIRFGGSHPAIRAALRRRSPRAYLLLTPDLAWQPDPLRESAKDREVLHTRYRTALLRGGLPFQEIAGFGNARMQAALDAIALWFPDLPTVPADAGSTQ